MVALHRFYGVMIMRICEAYRLVCWGHCLSMSAQPKLVHIAFV